MLTTPADQERHFFPHHRHGDRGGGTQPAGVQSVAAQVAAERWPLHGRRLGPCAIEKRHSVKAQSACAVGWSELGGTWHGRIRGVPSNLAKLVPSFGRIQTIAELVGIYWGNLSGDVASTLLRRASGGGCRGHQGLGESLCVCGRLASHCHELEGVVWHVP